MKLRNKRKITAWILCMMLIAAMAFTTVGCNKNKQDASSQTSTEAQVAVETVDNVLGEGQTQFAFTVVDKDGNETNFEIHTDKETVGEALIEVGLLEGEEGEYGLFVKRVNGITADYDVDQTYWAFYINGEYAMSGVDTTTVEDGMSYAFKVEK